VNDYDPFGNSMTSPITGLQPTFPAGTTASPYKYGGKEWNTTTSTYDFEARQMAPGFHRFTTMDPLCEKYYGISPYAYCANNPVNLVDPDGLTDWRAIGKGSLEVLAGVGSFAGGVVLSGGTGGAGSVIGAVLIFDGVSGIGLGVSKILIGIVSDPSEETENTVDSIPSSMTGTLLKSAGMIAGDDEHEIEILGGCFMALFGAGATQSISGTAEVLSWLGTGAQIVDLFASFTTEQKPTNNENQNEDNSRKELNRQAFHEAKVDW
jgi:RHS repeat-associated protein